MTRLIISMRETPVDIKWCRENKTWVRRLAANAGLVVRNILPITMYPIRKELMWGLYNGLAKRRLLRESSKKQKVPGGFDVTEEGTKEEMLREKERFEEFLYTSMEKTIAKERENWSEKFRKMAAGVKHKLYQTTVGMYGKMGIYVMCRLEEEDGKN